LGELVIPSFNARVLLRLAVLSAWAEIQIQSTHWDYVEALVTPQIPKLIPLWLSTLTAFAILQFEPEASDNLADDGSQDMEASDTSKNFLLQVRENWHILT
jgi:HEAT repeat-containing protein 5